MTLSYPVSLVFQERLSNFDQRSRHMKVLWIAIGGLILVGCATQPILKDEDYAKYCTEPGACEAYLRAKMLQYQNIGSVVVGVNPPPSPPTRDPKK